MQGVLVASSLDELNKGCDFSHLVAQGLVGSSPRAAIDEIARQFGEVPNRVGSNCSGIQSVREAISTYTGGDAESLTNAFVLVAPHTHWEPAPVIYTFDPDADRYWVGPNHGTAPFLAVSFLFHPSGPIPYEWADSSCTLKDDDLKQAWAYIDAINGKVSTQHWFSFPFPIGIAINFRFKSVFVPPTSSTHERPDITGRSSFSEIVRSVSTQDLLSVHDDQVGWSSSVPPELTSDDLHALSVLGDMLSELPAKESATLLESLTKS